MTRTELNEKREHLLKELNGVWDTLNETRIAYSPGTVATAMDKLMTRVHELRLVVRGWGVYETPDFD